MSVVVSFITIKGMGSIDAPGLGGCRVRETITVPGTTTATVAAGEMVMIASNETSMVLAAHGTTPDASAAAETTSTSAGYPIPTTGFMPVMPKAGDKINIKALA